jgi:hypothetical protein
MPYVFKTRMRYSPTLTRRQLFRRWLRDPWWRSRDAETYAYEELRRLGVHVDTTMPDWTLDYGGSLVKW